MASVPPPSQAPVEKGGSALIIIGVILLLGAAGGILWWVNRKPETPTTPPPVASAPKSAEPATTLDLPPIEMPKDAGDEAGADSGPKVAVPGGGGGCPATCTGQMTQEIRET